MKNYYLPKAFDLDINAPYCCDRQFGRSHTQPHWHSGVEMIYMVNGTAEVLYNNSWQTLNKNAMLFVPRGQLHCCRCFDPHAEKIVMGFTENCFAKSSIPQTLPIEVNNHCILFNLENTHLPALFNDFEIHCKNRGQYSEKLLTEASIFQIYANILMFWDNSGIHINNISHNKVDMEIYSYIEKHYSEKLSPYTAAKHLNMSYSSLAQKIKALESESFIKYVNRIRVENAKKLLAVTQKNVTEISFECGFSSTSYFIKVFRELTDMTPKVYRNLVNK